MRYTFVIQEMKASGNPNVLAFIRDVENMKRMTKKERDKCLKNRQNSYQEGCILERI